MSDLEVMTPAEWKKTKHEVNEARMLLAANSRYEDWGGQRVHVIPELDTATLIVSRKKPQALYVPDATAVTVPMLEAYACKSNLPLWLRPPLILPGSKAPWALEVGREHLLACGCFSSPVPKRALTSNSARREWELENIEEHPRRHMFLPAGADLEDVKSGSLTAQEEINVRLWDDARGPSVQRRLGILAEIGRLSRTGGSIERLVHFLPRDRDELKEPQPETHGGDGGELHWFGKEEALWASILDDPDIDLFGLDTEESVDWGTSKNLFMESDNLLALKRLQRGYEGKVKLEYIDPPYNTGGKFVYNDNFKAQVNTGSPFPGVRWGAGTWEACMFTEWMNADQLKSPRPLLRVDDTMLHPRSSDSPAGGAS